MDAKLSFVRIENTEGIERDSNHFFTIYSMVGFETNEDVFNYLKQSALSLIVEGFTVLYFWL